MLCPRSRVSAHKKLEKVQLFFDIHKFSIQKLSLIPLRLYFHPNIAIILQLSTKKICIYAIFSLPLQAELYNCDYEYQRKNRILAQPSG
jgi:hypothetical protein